MNTRGNEAICSGFSLSSVVVRGTSKSMSPLGEIWGRLCAPHLPKYQGTVGGKPRLSGGTNTLHKTVPSGLTASSLS